VTDLSATTWLGLPAATVLAVLLASVLCGFVGTFVVLRRLVALGGGIAHAAFGGIGLAVLAGWDPRLGAAGVAAVAATLLSALPRERSDRVDAVIGVLWAVGMAVGMLLLAGRSGGDVDVEGYLFGDISSVRPSDLLVLGVLVLFVLGLHAVCGRQLVAIAFDPDHAALQGVRVHRLSWILMLVVALSLVALLALVGVVLAIALLAIPPLVGLRLGRSLPAIVVLATATALATGLGGLWLAGAFAWPAGPTVVLTGAALLAISRLGRRRSSRDAR